MTLSDQALDALLKRLHLANTRRAWRDLTQRAEQEEWTYRDLLALVVSEEIAQRQQTRVARLVRRARFPFLKTVDDFNFLHQATVRLSLLGSALASEFVIEGRCVILTGKPGRGKTHLAVAIAYRAIQNGSDARFVTAAELIDDLSAAFRAGRLAEALGPYVQPSVLVVDDVGYLTYGTDAANMLFHVVNDRHRKKRAMVFTTNKPLAAWGQVLHDDDLAQAILDRILERGRLLTLDGPSMRTKHLGLDDPTSPGASDQPARISGIQRPNFRNPHPPKLRHDVRVEQPGGHRSTSRTGTGCLAGSMLVARCGDIRIASTRARPFRSLASRRKSSAPTIGLPRRTSRLGLSNRFVPSRSRQPTTGLPQPSPGTTRRRPRMGPARSPSRFGDSP
jgi:DNA replication protein DnaC